MKGIADTGLLVAFVNRNDRSHGWAVSIADQVSAPLEMLRGGLVSLAFSCSEHLPQPEALAACAYGKLSPLSVSCYWPAQCERHTRNTLVIVERGHERVCYVNLNIKAVGKSSITFIKDEPINQPAIVLGDR